MYIYFMELIRVTGEKEAEELGKIGREAFPPEEYISPERFIGGDTAVYKITEIGQACGYMCAALYDDLTYLFFFAVAADKRGRGTGSAALKAFIGLRPSVPVVVDPELAEKSADNYAQRLRRRNFYLGLGFSPTGKGMAYNGVSFELLCTGRLNAEKFAARLEMYRAMGFSPEYFDVAFIGDGVERL